MDITDHGHNGPGHNGPPIGHNGPRWLKMKRRAMDVPRRHDIDDIEDQYDPIVKINDPLLEVIIPPEEDTIFPAVRLNDREMLARRLREGVNVNIRHEGDAYWVKSPSMAHRIHTASYAPLHIATLHSTIKILAFLLDNNADVNIRDAQDRTPLHFAIVANRISVVNLLIQRGADMDAQSSSGRSPVLEAVIDGHFDSAQILVEGGANLDLLDNMKGTSVLHSLCFARRPNLEFIQTVIKAGCNINIANCKGATPIMFSSVSKHTKIVQALLDAGADINKRDSQGKTALDHVIQERSMGEQTIILFLIHRGADTHTKDIKGCSLMQKAVKNSAMNTIKILLSVDVPNDVEKLMEQPNIVKIFNYFPEFREWLLHELYTPTSLLRLCRGKIRGFLSPYSLGSIYDLDLPRQLQNFLLCRDVLCQHL